MKNVLIIILTFISVFSINAKNVNIRPTSTDKFISREGQDLYIDYFNAAKGSQTTINGKQKPAIIFVFGGGFIRGNRFSDTYKEWFKMLTDNGFKVFSIDYRLGLKGVKAKGLKFVNATENAIKLGVEDLFEATNYIIKNADKYDIQPNNLVVSGSSAGAIISLQAEYEISRQTDITKILPQNFNYAGVMAFSGAIFSRHGKLKFKQAPCPILMLHGTADKVVTYKQIKILHLGFFGADKISKRLKKFGHNYNVLRYSGNKHEVAEAMQYTLPEQLRFLETNVIRGIKRVIDATIADPDVPVDCSVGSLKDLYN